MITTVKIGDLDYTIKHVRDDDYDGSVTHALQQITVAPDITPYMQRLTLWHEMFHAIFKQTGQEDARHNEGLIEALSHQVVAIIRNNPALVEWTQTIEVKELKDGIQSNDLPRSND